MDVGGNEHHESLLEKIGRIHPEPFLLPNFLIKKYGTRFKNIKSTNLVQYVDRLCEWVFQNNPRYSGRLEAIGSDAEGIRVNTSDYDFLLVSDASKLQLEKLEIKHAEMPSVRADLKSENNLLKSYFKVFFNDDVPQEWKDCTETGSKSLNARMVQRTFSEALADIVNPETEPNWNDQPTSFTVLNKVDNTVTMNGPAVSIDVIDKTNDKPKKINIDITFAIPLNLTDSTDFWPLDGQFPGVELTDHVKTGQPIKAVHLVPAGDFWRLSFVLEERERMKKLLLDENKHTCMVALKAMRNSVSLTRDDESPLLSSYPLKWSFMMETRGTEDKTWQENTLGNHVSSILDRVVQCGGNGSMSSYFLKGDPILKDSDRSYLESRRIQKLIKDENHTTAYLFSFYFLLNVTSVLSVVCYLNLFIPHFLIIDGILYLDVRHNSTECAPPSTRAALMPIWSALVPILPGFILYVSVVVVMAFGVFAEFKIVPQIFFVSGTLYSCLLQPILVLTIVSVNAMKISYDMITLQILLKLVLMLAWCIHGLGILTLIIYCLSYALDFLRLVCFLIVWLAIVILICL